MGGQIASTATSGTYTIPGALSGGFFGWIRNTNGAATMRLNAPAGCSFTPNVTSKTFGAGHAVYVQNINGWIFVKEF